MKECIDVDIKSHFHKRDTILLIRFYYGGLNCIAFYNEFIFLIFN